MNGPPQRLRGSHLSAGIYWPIGELPTAPDTWEKIWHSGDRLFSLKGGAEGHLLLFARPRRMRAGDVIGGDIVRAVRTGGWSCLDPAGAPPFRCLEVGHGGQTLMLRVPNEALPLQQILRGCSFSHLNLCPLGVPPKPPDPSPTASFSLVTQRLGLTRPETPPPEAPPAARSRLGDRLAAWGGMLVDELVALFRPKMAPQKGTVRRGPDLAAPRGPGWWSRLLARLDTYWRDLFPPRTPKPPQPPSPPGWFRQFWDRLGQRLPVWRWLTWMEAAQAKALAQLLDRFARSDLIEALRHAIPLGGDGDAPPAGWFFGRFGRRDSFNLSASGRAAALRASQEVLGLLRRAYLDAHQRLDREGDIERAAWVLAELLRDKPGAVAYLESRERYLLAAEWSQSLGLPLATTLRLLVRGNAVDRAYHLGLSQGAFVVTLLLIEKEAPEAAWTLRGKWAQTAWAMGAEEQAVSILWPARLIAGNPAPDILRRWLFEVFARPGVVPAWAWIASNVNPPLDQFPPLDPKLAQGGPELRRALARTILGLGTVDAAFLDPLLRGLAGDLALPGRAGRIAAAQVPTLLARAPADTLQWLRADLPPFPHPVANPPAPALAFPAGEHQVAIEDQPATGYEPRDGALGLDDTLWVALGDAGLIQWNRADGVGAPSQHRWPISISHLLRCGEAMLGFSRQSEDTYLVYRLVPGQKPVVLGPIQADHPCSTVDPEGLLWCKHNGSLSAWIVGFRGLEPVWSSGRVGESLLAITTCSRWIRALVRLTHGIELWRWERTGGPTLRERRAITTLPSGDLRGAALWDDHTWLWSKTEQHYFIGTTLQTLTDPPGARPLGPIWGARALLLPGEIRLERSNATAKVDKVSIHFANHARFTILREAPDGLVLLGQPNGVFRTVELRTKAEIDRWVPG